MGERAHRHTGIEQLAGERIAVTVGQERYVVGAACPHRKGRLAYGWVNERTRRLACPLHHSTFDLASGCPLTGPSEDPLPTYEDRE